MKTTQPKTTRWIPQAGEWAWHPYHGLVQVLGVKQGCLVEVRFRTLESDGWRTTLDRLSPTPWHSTEERAGMVHMRMIHDMYQSDDRTLRN